jgi:uncharacterized Ntn-hydrolase superfamily protein
MTFALAGLCRESGQIGCAVTTSSVCVGARCGRVAADCVVFSQARTDPRLHQVGLDAHARTGDPAAAIEAMKAAATSLHWRQLGILDRSGTALHFTGESCLPSCGGLAGSDCLALGNYLGSDEVLPSMIQGFEITAGSLAKRLIAGLEAGLSSGSELDPLQSAALLIYSGETFAYADLRVDKSPNPIADLDLLWRDWEPKADAYVIRTLDPDSAIPSREVEKQA